MDTAPGSVSKREKALEAAALIAFASEMNASPVGLVMFDGSSGKVLKPRAGRDQILTILASLDHGNRPCAGSALGGALAGAARVLRSRSLVVVISDFRTTGYEKSLGILSRRHDVLAVRIVSPSDSELPDAGYIQFVDPETGVRASFPTGSASFREHWEREHRESVARWEHVCSRRGVSSLVLSSADDAVRELSRFFSVPGGGRK
jgi:uncharacterized protein (DUF58 family)